MRTRLIAAINRSNTIPRTRPFVTLTFAQSLDGSIAAIKGQHLVISSRNSLYITHELRTLHDGILVGIGTVLSDNPLLTSRLYPGPSPIPIIIDSQINIPISSNVLKRPSILICSHRDMHEINEDGIVHVKAIHDIQSHSSQYTRLLALHKASPQCMIIALKSKRYQMDWSDILKSLNPFVRSIMCEGGISVISGLVATLNADNMLVDHVLITISPVFIGGARAIDRLMPTMPRLCSTLVTQCSPDAIIQGFTHPIIASHHTSMISRFGMLIRPFAFVFLITWNAFTFNKLICLVLQHTRCRDIAKLRTRLIVVIIGFVVRYTFQRNMIKLPDKHIDARTHLNKQSHLNGD